MDKVSLQQLNINGSTYQILDSLQDLRAEDSFIHRSNKLAQFDGNGESKKYVGSYKDNNISQISNFFEYKNWGIEYKDPTKNQKTFNSAINYDAVIQNNTCFFSKSNLLKYLEDAKVEYFKQDQGYQSNISQHFINRLEEIKSLKSDYIFFSIYDASDGITQSQSRAYIRSDDIIWKIWRKLILPKITYLSILKLKKIEPNSYKEENPIFYFRILLDYQYRSIVHPSILENHVAEQLTLEQKKKKNRIGADKFRKDVLAHMPQCPFTQITDERLLIASHIKPYAVCIDEAKIDEATDYLNGLSLSPTYDWLFDQGYITFTDNGELICGTQLSSLTWSKLNINPASRKKMRIYPEDRSEYLNYHRNHVFQGEIKELIFNN
jgi:putative restriction endonuclease